MISIVHVEVSKQLEHDIIHIYFQSLRSFKGSTRSHVTSIADSERGRRIFRNMRRGSDGKHFAVRQPNSS
jgi:hypothetical protein